MKRVTANQDYLYFLGYPSEEAWRSEPSYDSIAEYDIPVSKAARERLCVTGLPQVSEIDMVSRSGELYTVRWKDVPLRNGNGIIWGMRCTGRIKAKRDTLKKEDSK